MREYAIGFARSLDRQPGERFGAWLDRKTLDFIDYWNEKPGADGVKLDWLRAWQRWMRREIERSAEQAQAAGQNGHKPGHGVALRAEPRLSTADLRVADAMALAQRLSAEEGSP
jgi:hypothetical protein